MKHKNLVKLGMAAIAAMLLASGAYAQEEVKHANEDAPSTEISEETLVIGLSSEPSGLWGAGVGKAENEMMIIGAAIADRLVTVDQNTGDVLPCLASEWEWTDDTHCRFTLRDDVVMTDGTMLEAADVEYSVNTWMQYSANTDTGRFLSDVSVEDEHTVTIGFNVVAPDLLCMLAWANFGIVTEQEITDLGGSEAANRNPLFGCGKYRFKEWANGQYITLERNENYWDQDYKGYFKEIKFIFTNDPSARAMAVQSGDLEVAYDMPVSMAATFRDNDQVNLIASEFGQNTRLWYNMGPNAGATADIRVRKAIDKALDFNAIAMVGTAGFGEEVHGYFPKNSKFYNEIFTSEERTLDIEGAKELLKEAGYEDGLSLSIVGLQDQNPIYVVIQENLRQIGIDLTINVVDTAQFVEQANGGTYDLIHVGDLVKARYPAIFTFFRQRSIDTFCIGGAKWTTPEIESAIDALIQESDEKQAKENARVLEEMLKEEMPYSNTYCQMSAALTAKDIKGYNTIERGFIDCTGFYK